MIAVRIPSALRPYAGGQKEVTLDAVSVDGALLALTERYPGLKPHLYDEADTLRQYVNLFVNEQDVRSLQGGKTSLQSGDRMMIVPSIAGGSEAEPPRPIDHSALRVNQAAIIVFLLVAFIFNAAWLVAGVAAILWTGTLLTRPGFQPVYRGLRRLGWVRPEVVQDHPQPHRFAQGLGAAFLSLALLLLLGGASAVGWALAWVVAGLAALNLFAGFCAGCAVYYWLQRAAVPGFSAQLPPGTTPGRRPRG